MGIIQFRLWVAARKRFAGRYRAGGWAGGPQPLPGLACAAVRAGDGRGDRCGEDVATLAGVGGPIERASGGAYALDGDVARSWTENREDRRDRRLGAVLLVGKA